MSCVYMAKTSPRSYYSTPHRRTFFKVFVDYMSLGPVTVRVLVVDIKVKHLLTRPQRLLNLACLNNKNILTSTLLVLPIDKTFYKFEIF